MARINLLPWREELRAERKKQFLSMLGLVALLAVMVLLVLDQVVSGQINHQNQRNSYLKQHIAELDAKVAEIRDLQRKRTQLIERMRVIQELQGNRPIIVRILDQLVRTVPDGVFYTSLTTKDGAIAIQGVAESNNRVSSLMRRLDASDWLEQPNLDAVRSAPQFGEQATTFNLTVRVQLPETDKTLGGGEAGR
jgi:type IV pilus assembly protein PilN